MKIKCFLLTMCLLFCGAISAQNKLFDKYADNDSITIVSISKSMFELMKGHVNNAVSVDGKNVDFDGLLDNAESLRIITSGKKTMREKMRTEFKSSIKKGYEELMMVRKENSKITFNAKKKGNLINELIMLVDGDENFVAMQLLGNFTTKDIENISEKIK